MSHLCRMVSGMTLLRRTAATLLIPALPILGVPPLPASPASASPAPSEPVVRVVVTGSGGPASITWMSASLARVSCVTNHTCVWTAADYGGSVEMTPTSTAGLCFNLSFPNQASALRNNSAREVRYHDGNGCTGTSWRIYRDEAWRNLAVAWTLGAPNDKFNSVYIVG